MRGGNLARLGLCGCSWGKFWSNFGGRLLRVRLRARLVSGGRDDTRGASCGLRPCRVRNLSECNIVGNDPCAVPYNIVPGTRVRRYIRALPAHKTSAIDARCNKFIPPKSNKKLPPRAPAPNKANQIFALHGRVLSGEVLGERGRFGGGEPPLSRGGSPPPRSFSPTFQEGALPPRSSPPTFRQLCLKRGEKGKNVFAECGVDKNEPLW